MSKGQEKRFFISAPGDSIRERGLAALEAHDLHYAKNVLRIQPGDRVAVVSRVCGTEFEGVVDCSELTGVTLSQLKERTERKSFPPVTKALFFALCKGKRTTLVCEKATELGVEHLVLWQAENSVVQVRNENERIKKEDKLRAVVEGAARQSKQNLIPQVHLLPSLPQVIELSEQLALPGERKFCCSLRKEAISIQKIRPLRSPCQVIVGPEGDLSSQEQDTLEKQGFELVSLGPNTLRSETAAIAVLAMLTALRELPDEMPRM